VQLTSAGHEFQREIEATVARLDRALERSKVAARMLAGTLRLDLFSRPASGPRLVEIIRAFETLHPECQIEVAQLSWDDPLGRLRAGDVDLIAVWVPLHQPDLVVGPTLSSEPRVLAVARDHPLAGRDSVDIEEIAEHRVARFADWPPALHEAIVPLRTPAGRTIPSTPIPSGERTVLDLSVRVARGELVHPTVASARAYMGALDLAFVELTGLPPLRSALVWRRPARDPKLRAFIRVARDIIGSRP
jgi:DNA-binding transcriptional LysR family regulator